MSKKNPTHEFIKRSGVFAISVLSRKTPLKFIGNFGFKSGREGDKFTRVRYRVGRTGAPLLLDHTLAHLEAEVVGEVDLGTHTLFLGRVMDAEVVREEPMTYSYYREVKGKPPLRPPLFMRKNRKW